MRIPFEKLMEYAAALSDADAARPMGELAYGIGEDAWRLADAIVAVRVMRGERTYVPVDLPAGTGYE